jgi:carboxyl-terminal processing protease
MLPATNRGVGLNLGFPDVCLTPVGPAVVPIPYPNLAMHGMAVGFSPNVILTGMNALSISASVPLTMGDEAGVAHPFIKQAGRFMMGNPVVSVNGMPGVCLCCPTSGNNANDALGAVLVPSATNVFYTYAAPVSPAPEGAPADPFARDLSAADLEALSRELASVGREDGPPVVARLLAAGVGLIAVRVFSADVPARVFIAVRELEAQGMRSLVIDLRDNPGGEARAFVELAGDFLEAGSDVATMVDGEGDETVYRSSCEEPHRMPVTVLVNRGTASAAELFAECLQAHGRATVQGGPTYGKHLGQAVVVGPDGRPRTATVAGFRTGG